jgi:hypothetical protein
MSTLSGGPNIVTDGLVLYLDAANEKSYPTVGGGWRDLKTNSNFINSNYSTANWANNITTLTICTVVEKTGNDPGYATHPINKWNTGTGNASFVLYHFGATGGQGNFSFYYTAGTTWAGQFAVNLSIGQKAFLAFQWNSITGGQVWRNGVKVGSRSGSGTLGVGGNSVLNVFTPTNSPYTIVHTTSFYSKELTDLEILQNYNATKSRYNL